jgi:hypothetical protein
MGKLVRSGAVAFAVLVVAKLALTPIAAVGVPVALRESAWSAGHYFALRRAAPFDHDRHVGRLGLDCRDCHAAPSAAPSAAARPGVVCAICHLDVALDAPVAAPSGPRLAPLEPIRWLRARRAADPLAADPAVHLAHGAGCTGCHGS